jgi:hypothetical protein
LWLRSVISISSSIQRAAVDPVIGLAAPPCHIEGIAELQLDGGVPGVWSIA